MAESSEKCNSSGNLSIVELQTSEKVEVVLSYLDFIARTIAVSGRYAYGFEKPTVQRDVTNQAQSSTDHTATLEELKKLQLVPYVPLFLGVINPIQKEENLPRILPPKKDEKKMRTPQDISSVNLDDEGVEVKFELDENYLKGLDPKLWKDQDHYHVLGLQSSRYFASDDDIRRAYRKIVLKHHPDKRKGQGESINPDDDYFTCITRAYEILGNSTRNSRKSYDSVDPSFNDDLPSISEVEKDFFGVLSPIFRNNSRWSEKKIVPLLGNNDSEREHVENFYQFWYDFSSWREYSYLDEEDKDKGQDRDERRWIDKQNKTMRIKRKKEEMARIRQLVDLAWNNDPRIGRFKKEERDRKLAAKRAKQTAAQAQKDEEDRQAKEILAVKLKMEQEEKLRVQYVQREKESQKRLLKKERKALRDWSRANLDDKNKIKNIEDVEKICDAFKLLELQELNNKIQQSADPLVGQRILYEAVAIMDEELAKKREVETNSYINNMGKSTATPLTTVNKKSLWGNENVQLLIKAVNLFPAGTNQRWEVVANFINLHATNLPENVSFNSKDVLNKAKDIQSSDFTKNDLKAQVNLKAFESFEKNKKELRIVDNSEISTKDAGDIRKPTQTNNHADGTESKINGDQTAAEKKTWTKEEQTLLEQAIKTYPLSTVDRWERIAECIPNRSKKDCLKRVKELVDLVNSRKKSS